MTDGDELASVWNQYSTKLLLVARAVGEPAEDAVQEAFLKLASQYKMPEDPMAWLVVVVRNQLLTWNRTGTRRRNHLIAKSSQQAWFAESDSSIQIDSTIVSERLQTLEPLNRQIVVMHLWGELSFEQIGLVMNSPRSTVHRKYREAITRLRKELK